MAMAGLASKKMRIYGVRNGGDWVMNGDGLEDIDLEVCLFALVLRWFSWF